MQKTQPLGLQGDPESRLTPVTFPLGPIEALDEARHLNGSPPLPRRQSVSVVVAAFPPVSLPMPPPAARDHGDLYG